MLTDMDLTTFFERSSPHGNFRWNFTFFSALHKIALALSSARNICLLVAIEAVDSSGIGYRQDLRPLNILVNDETFVLADIGLGSLKLADQESQTRWKARAGDYQAPEYRDEDVINPDISKAIDVWAFGCLMAEVATFMQLAAEGLAEFRTVRLSQGSFTECATSYFYDGQGNAKTSVKQWLSSLPSNTDLPALYGPFLNLIFDILTPIGGRPTIQEICPRLAILSVKAHFFAALQSLASVIEPDPSTGPAIASSMKIWIERERLKAFGRVLCLHGGVWDASVLEHIEHETMSYVAILLQVFKRLQESHAVESLTGVNNKSRASEVQPDYANTPVTPFDGRMTEFQNVLEVDIQKLIQQLWDSLPEVLVKKAETVWMNSMLETDDIDHLHHMEQALSSEKLNSYQEAAAMAMMKRIRLEMTYNPARGSELIGLEIQPNDVVISDKYHGHQLGTYQKTVPIIIEWMNFDRSLEKIPSSERTLVMALKAQGFSINHKPESLRLLHCLGFFEQTQGSRLGYGFFYRIPPREHVAESLSEPLTTLLHLLTLFTKKGRPKSRLNQPSMGDKYRLAYMLAEFLRGFHSIGWLHENFHSNNVIFFNAIHEGQSVTATRRIVMTEPYVVGLHKSRPGGDAWHTQGPALEAKFLTYQHPDYAITKRFRNGYDYYSLGLALLEIGLWTPLIDLSDKPPFRNMSPHQFRDVIVGLYVSLLHGTMGEAYQDVVKLLLNDGLDPEPKRKDPDQNLERGAFNKFCDEVVDTLAALSNVHV